MIAIVIFIFIHFKIKSIFIIGFHVNRFITKSLYLVNARINRSLKYYYESFTIVIIIGGNHLYSLMISRTFYRFECMPERSLHLWKMPKRKLYLWLLVFVRIYRRILPDRYVSWLIVRYYTERQFWLNILNHDSIILCRYRWM